LYACLGLMIYSGMDESDQNRHFLDRPATVWVVVIICVAVEIGLSGADYGLWATSRFRQQAYENGGFWIGLLNTWDANYNSQPYVMFASYAFLHGGIVHLAVNMFTLLTLGPLVVFRIGQPRFVLLYVLSMLGGAVGFALISDSFRPMVGASGALFGLAGAIVAWEYIDRFTAELRLWPVLQLVVMLITLNVVMWWAMDGQLAWQTHLGGFVSGWILAFLIDPRARPVEQE
jgi:rhomboid protease GluP